MPITTDDQKNLDPTELEKFNRIADNWWNTSGEFRPLHVINPVRSEYIRHHVNLAGKTCIDVGCGGGILTEELARFSQRVVGIDPAETSIKVARQHGLQSKFESQLEYVCVGVHEYVDRHAGEFDVGVCMEMLEHVPDYNDMIDVIAKLIKPGGSLFLSTINRNFTSYIKMVIGAEYVLSVLPRGTHDYERFIKPSELATAAISAGLTVVDIQGYKYNPFNHTSRLSSSVDVNYFVYAKK